MAGEVADYYVTEELPEPDGVAVATRDSSGTVDQQELPDPDDLGDEAVDERGVFDVEDLNRTGLRLDRGSKGPARMIGRFYDELHALLAEEQDAGTHLADEK
jgi:hypothetical protein